MSGIDDLKNFPIPEIAKGTVIPTGIQMQQIKEAKEKERLQKMKQK